MQLVMQIECLSMNVLIELLFKLYDSEANSELFAEPIITKYFFLSFFLKRTIFLINFIQICKIYLGRISQYSFEYVFTSFTHLY